MRSGDGGAESPEEILQALGNELMSPYCPGRTISSCPSGQARKLEDEILAQARAGRTREEIEAELVQRYGSDIIGYRPPPIVLYGTVLVAIAALMLVVMVGRRWVRRNRSTAPGAGEVASGGRRDVPPPSRAEIDALEDALDEEDGF